MRILATASALLLAGCAQGVGSLAPPAARLMQSTVPLADEKEGEDLVIKHEALRANYAQCTSRLRGLQRYVRTATE